MAIPEVADRISARFRAAFAERHPGRLRGLYLVGSIALEDFRPGHSDVDFVAVTQAPVALEDVAPIHAELPKSPFFDGIYVTEDELRVLPDNSRSGVAVIEGTPIAGSKAERHAVTWLTLARHGVALVGPPPAEVEIRTDLASARDYSRANLIGYWRPWIEARRSLASRNGPHDLTLDAVAWSVLGLSRLHALFVDGQILSITAAGVYARSVFPEHRAIIDCALAARGGRPAIFPGNAVRRHQAMMEFLDRALADALGFPAGR